MAGLRFGKAETRVRFAHLAPPLKVRQHRADIQIMFNNWFKKSQAKVIVGEQLAEVLAIQVKVRTPIGEFWIDQNIGNMPSMRPNDSVTFTWTWQGFRTQRTGVV